MKAFFVVCLAMAVMAESDPNLILTNSGLGLVNTFDPLLQPVSYISLNRQPVVVKKQEDNAVEVEAESEVTVNSADNQERQHVLYSGIVPTTQYVSPFYAAIRPTYVAKNGEVEHIVSKREADPLTVVNGQIVPGLYSGLLPAVAPAWYSNKATFINPFTGEVTGKVTNDAVTANNYANKGQYVARAPGSNTVHIAKREAEAEPWTVFSNPMVYGAGLVNPMWSTLGARSVVYSNPAVYRTAVVSAPTGVEGVVAGRTVANDAWQITPGYAAKGQYVAQTPGTSHIAKREAEADPLTIYRSPLRYTSVVNPVYRTSYFNPVVRTVNPVVRTVNPVVSSLYSGLYF